ncbi:putative RNA-binding Zn ribbon-like protein [Sphingomonas sp. UYAg733]
MEKAQRRAGLAEERDGFRFRGGHTAIDLTATLAGRLRAAPRELLEMPADLARWLVAADLAATLPEAGGDDLADAHRLREAIYALAKARLPGGTDAAAARDVLNEIAGAPSAIPRLSGDGIVQLIGTAGALLVSLARDAVHLFGGEAADRIRQCQSPTCTLFFIDTSRAADRRWCSMSGCGNKAKVAEFRRRKHQGHLPA